MTDKLVVPRRKVRKDWYGGLDPDPVDRRHPDVRDEELVHEAEADHIKSMLGKLILDLRNCFFNVFE